MSDTNLKRRAFLRMGIAGSSFLAAGGIAVFSQASQRDAIFNAPLDLQPLQPADANGIMLPPGFKSRIVARSSLPATDSSDYVWHASPDGWLVSLAVMAAGFMFQIQKLVAQKGVSVPYVSQQQGK